MQHRSPARMLAPLALIAAMIAVYVVAQPETDSGSASVSTAVQTQAPAAKRPSPSSPRRAKSYVVRPGDTLSGIAETTGLTVEHITKLNVGLDANNLNVGRRLVLRR